MSELNRDNLIKSYRQAYDRFVDFVDNKATLINHYLSAHEIKDIEKTSTGLMWMIIGNCASFERFVWELHKDNIEQIRKPQKIARQFLETKYGKESQKVIDFEAYFIVRHALVHFGGFFGHLYIWKGDSEISIKVREQLDNWGFKENTDAFDFSEASHRVLDNAWSGQARIFKQWGKEILDCRIAELSGNVKGLFSSPEEADEFIREERDSWDE